MRKQIVSPPAWPWLAPNQAGSTMLLWGQQQRQWSDLAIERTTPCLLSLYAIVTLLAHALYPGGQLPVRATAWYPKRQATFADALAAVRHHLWSVESFSTSPDDTDVVEIPKARLERLMQSVCYSY